MKYIIVSIVSLFSLATFSQLTLKKLDGTAINNGDILVFNQVTEPANYLGLKIYNSSSEDVTVKIKVVSFPAGQGSNLQLCINPICVSSLIAGNSYPGFGSTIPANGQNGNADHFINSNVGNGVSNLDYVLKLFRVDDNNVEVGNNITFTYRYSPNLSVSDFNQLSNLGIQLKSTIVTSNVVVNSIFPTQANVFDLNGKLLISQNIIGNNNLIEVTNFAKGLYILKFTTSDGKNATIKFKKE